MPNTAAVAILLAAGLSERMGRTKALLPWDGRTLIEYAVAELLDAGVAEVIVVTGHDAEAVGEAARRAGARTVHNTAYRDGRAGSVRAGAGAVDDGSGAIVLLNVDQPRPAAAIRTLIMASSHDGAAITVPVVSERRGHPAVFAARLLPELRAVTEAEEGLRAVMHRHAADVREVAIDDPRLLLDVNTPAAYAEARRAFGLPELA